MAKVQPRTLSGVVGDVQLAVADDVDVRLIELPEPPPLGPLAPIDLADLEPAIRRSFSLYGFTPLDTPLIEASEVLLAKGGGETEKR